MLTEKECQRYFGSDVCPTLAGITASDLTRHYFASQGLSDSEIDLATTLSVALVVAFYPPAAACLAPAKLDAKSPNHR
jgi:hypothetical protein